ncbi:ATP-binding protein [Tissierella sp.]|uniref:ATP-binding protein n=1 Tax=Tissierella sp. TaxID=41274 RepID=UPI0028B22B15|nr:ATP-binding protein [Tissierella sp.]
MKQLLILSGKGGTGKTTVASAFIKLANAKAFADCDVDAPNLHLLMNQISQPIISDYYGMDKAFIDTGKCKSCGICKESCRFDAIKLVNEEFKVDYFSCEGCGVCEEICSFDAIALRPDIAGKLTLYTKDKIFSTAQLKMGSGTSGKLVSEVKKQMKESVENADLAIIDGSPGIGCPVIASLSGVDMVLIVAEPSLSGINDMLRIIRTAKKLNVKTLVCVNKYDTNVENTNKIKSICEQLNLAFVGEIPYDKEVIKAINTGQSIVDVKCKAGNAAKDVFKNTMKIINE